MKNPCFFLKNFKYVLVDFYLNGDDSNLGLSLPNYHYNLFLKNN